MSEDEIIDNLLDSAHNEALINKMRQAHPENKAMEILLSKVVPAYLDYIKECRNQKLRAADMMIATEAVATWMIMDSMACCKTSLESLVKLGRTIADNFSAAVAKCVAMIILVRVEKGET